MKERPICGSKPYPCEKRHGRIDKTLLETLPANFICDERIYNPHHGINTIVKYTKTRTNLIVGNDEKNLDTVFHFIIPKDCRYCTGFYTVDWF